MKRRSTVIVIIVIIALAGGLFFAFGRSMWFPLYMRVRGERTIEQAVAQFGPKARARLKPYLDRAGVRYPPRRIALLVFKQERKLALWASNDTSAWRYVRSYPVLAASGHAGPKLREGDRQVPEGLYRLEYLNPNSSYHLSMKVDYPNAHDRAMARRDGRTRLGGDIFIHGNQVSIGCVAVGDPAIEELFTLVAEAGIQRVKVIIAPNDIRIRGAVMHEETPAWMAPLYQEMRRALRDFPAALESDSGIDVRGMPKARIKL